MTRKIRVMIVEDSLVVRELLRHIVERDGRFEVVAVVGSAEECLNLLATEAPDVISLDIRLPGMNGLDATLRIMAARPTPIVVVAAHVDDDELNITMNALRAGALAVVEKPVALTNEAFERVASKICTQLAIMSQIRVVRQGIDRGLNFGAGPKPFPPPRPVGDYSLLGVAASTGGPQAVVRLLEGLGRDFPLPVLLVQHITPSFLDGFASWLSGVTPFKARIAAEGQVPHPGHVYMAPADRHLAVVNGSIVLLNSSPVAAQRPSATVLFKSMAYDCGGRGIGVVLTGMGNDGAEGLAEMRRAGAYTLGEDASTCVVYGMPQAAAALNAVCELLPLPAISQRVAELVRSNRRQSRA